MRSERCPHCQVTVVFKDAFEKTPVLSEDERGGARVALYVRECPACWKLVIDRVPEQYAGNDEWYDDGGERLHPQLGGSRELVEHAAIPPQLRQLYNEAVRIEPASVRGAAGLLRLCLEAVLFHEGFKERNLDQQIDAALKVKQSWPKTLLSKLHLVRFLGNWSVHWSLDDKGEVIPVEAGELDAVFSTVEQLFRVVWVDPHAAAADVAALNTKLEKAGKSMRIGPDGSIVDDKGQPWQPPKRKG